MERQPNVIRDIPIVLTAYLGWRYYRGTKIVSLDEIPLADAFAQAEQSADAPGAKQKGLIRYVSWVWD